LEKASVIQELSYPAIFQGQDVIIGAETGSGKTFAYFLPLLDRYLSKLTEAEDVKPEVDADSWEASVNHHQRKLGIILAPNAPLCDQIVSMINPIMQGLQNAGLPVKLSKASYLAR
jgi:superfamily II DNA/RNA helicase